MVRFVSVRWIDSCGTCLEHAGSPVPCQQCLESKEKDVWLVLSGEHEGAYKQYGPAGIVKFLPQEHHWILDGQRIMLEEDWTALRRCIEADEQDHEQRQYDDWAAEREYDEFEASESGAYFEAHTQKEDGCYDSRGEDYEMYGCLYLYLDPENEEMEDREDMVEDIPKYSPFLTGLKFQSSRQLVSQEFTKIGWGCGERRYWRWVGEDRSWKRFRRSQFKEWRGGPSVKTSRKRHSPREIKFFYYDYLVETFPRHP